MNQLIPAGTILPSSITTAGDRASYRFLEFFTARIRNPHTRRSYGRGGGDFCAWLEARGHTRHHPGELFRGRGLGRAYAAGAPCPTVKQRLAAVRMMFDWLATGGVMPFNPATAVRGPKHSVKKGKTPVLAPEEARQLLDSIDITTPIGLRDRALIGLMVYSFGRIGATLAMLVEDVFTQQRRLWVRLHEKGGKEHVMPCHHNLENTCMPISTGCSLAEDPQGPLFRTIGRGTKELTRTPLPQAQCLGDDPAPGSRGRDRDEDRQPHVRATGITAYLKNGGTLERAA
jgi:site-specific recombinase XerC